MLSPSLRFLCVAIVMLSVVGCSSGGDELERAGVSGTVTWNGQPLEKGSIRLFPEDGVDAPMSGADIIEGKYTVSNKGGVAVGVYRVEITADRVVGDPLPGETNPVTEQFIPAQYNTQSSLTLNVPTADEAVVQDFDLTE